MSAASSMREAQPQRASRQMVTVSTPRILPYMRVDSTSRATLPASNSWGSQRAS